MIAEADAITKNKNIKLPKMLSAKAINVFIIVFFFSSSIRCIF